MKSQAVRFFESQAEFREWLEGNHEKAQELSVGLHKKGSKLAGISYPQALDEALCFGWIDGVRNRIDAGSYKIRFTPRRPNSFWSAVNIKRVRELSDAGLMRPSGLATFEARNEKRTRQYSFEQKNPALDSKSEETFRASERAWTFFEAQPASYRRLRTWWVISAKKDETRRKRLEVLIEMCAQGRRLDPMKSPFKQVEEAGG